VPARAGCPHVREDEHAVHELRVSDPIREPPCAGVTARSAVDRGEYERLVRRPAGQNPRHLDQGGGIRAASGRVGHGERIARREQDQLVRREPRAPADHVHERGAAVLEAVDGGGEPETVERGGHAGGRPAVAGGPDPAIPCGVHDLAHLGGREAAVEQHVGWKALRHGRRAVLQGERRDYRSQQRREERGAIEPGLDHFCRPKLRSNLHF